MWALSYIDRISLDSLKRVERPDPAPGPRDVVLQMRSAALNYRDLALAQGNYHIRAQPPLIPLSDGVGEVIEAGSEVSRFRRGDLASPVYLPDWIDGPVTSNSGKRRLGGPSDGVLCEFKCVNEEEAVLIPPSISSNEAATLPVTGVTAWHALNSRTPIRAGETFLIQGTGGLSLAAIQIAKMAAARVVVLTHHASSTSKLKELGADIVIPRGDSDDWPADVHQATSGNGADISMDVLGGESLNRTISATRVGGCVHLAGFVKDTSATIDIFQTIRQAVTIHVATAGHRASFEALLRAQDLNGVHPVVGTAFPMLKLFDAFQQMVRGPHWGKIVIELPV